MSVTEAGWFAKYRGSIHTVSLWFERAGLVAMAAMGLTTLVDVVGSKFFHLPLPGSTEIIGVVQILAIAGGLAFSKIDGRQIRVDGLLNGCPQGTGGHRRIQRPLGLGFSFVALWMSF
jgi:TRAP-type C4-dicarboxylate transport system permease small subunit